MCILAYLVKFIDIFSYLQGFFINRVCAVIWDVRGDGYTPITGGGGSFFNGLVII